MGSTFNVYIYKKKCVFDTTKKNPSSSSHHSYIYITFLLFPLPVWLYYTILQYCYCRVYARVFFSYYFSSCFSVSYGFFSPSLSPAREFFFFFFNPGHLICDVDGIARVALFVSARPRQQRKKKHPRNHHTTAITTGWQCGWDECLARPPLWYYLFLYIFNRRVFLLAVSPARSLIVNWPDAFFPFFTLRTHPPAHFYNNPAANLKYTQTSNAVSAFVLLCFYTISLSLSDYSPVAVHRFHPLSFQYIYF